MSVFHQLCTPLQEALLQRGWKSLRHIQEIAFPEITAGKNVFLIAQTAGGKTEAAFLPTLNQFYGSQEDGVKILYVAPLRALLNNIEDRLISSGICDAVNLQIFKWHGDVSRSKKLTTAKKGTDILLTTPESLDVILCSPYIDKQKFFAPLQVAILDETHYFAGSDRGAQLVCVLNRLDLLLNRDIQRICLSATVGNPVEVLSWMCSPSKRQQAVINGLSGKIERTAELIYYTSDDESQIANAVTAYSLGIKSIIFEPSRRKAESRSKDFTEKPSICFVHHSSVDKFWREEAEKQLLEAKSSATVIATCTLELGLDVGDLDLIQQEDDFPSVSSYVQRIGRTGRVHPPQRCYVHVTDEFDFLKNLAIMSLADEGYVEDNLLQGNFYHLLLQQLVMLSLGNNGFPITQVEKTLLNCASTLQISKEELDDLLNHWVNAKLLRIVDGLLLIGEEIERRYGPTNYMDLYVLFECPQTFEVWHGRTAIGTLDLLFVRTKREKFVFILAGKWWIVDEIDYDDAKVFVKPISTAPPPASWASPRGREVSYDIAQRIKQSLLTKDDSRYLRQPDSKQFLLRLRQQAMNKGLSKSNYQIQTILNGKFIVTNYAGDKVNLLITSLAKKLRGWIIEDVNYESMIFSTKDNFTKNTFEDFVHQILSNNLLTDKSLLLELVEPFDEENVSKWSAWLPQKYRLKFLVEQVFDLKSTFAWLSAY